VAALATPRPQPQPLPLADGWTGHFQHPEPLPYLFVQPTTVAEIAVDTSREPIGRAACGFERICPSTTCQRHSTMDD
jgi:hypothetical protein